MIVNALRATGKKVGMVLALAVVLAGCQPGGSKAVAPATALEGMSTLQDEKTAVVVGEDGSLLSLRNLVTGTDYAGGKGLWRLYFNTPERKEIEVRAADQTPAVSV